MTRTQLRAAKALIENERRWCTGKGAKDAAGRGCSVMSPEAVQWCALGACMRVMNVPFAIGPVLTSAAFDLYGFSPQHVNDNIGHAAVMKVFDRAIEQAEEEE